MLYYVIWQYIISYIYYILYMLYYIYLYYIYIYYNYIYIYYIYILYLYIYVRCIYIILYYICILYIYTIIYVIGWRFCCCFYPPKSWFLLVCLGDKVYLPGSRWFQPSDSTAPVFLSAHALSCWTPDKMADKSGSPGALGWSSENSQFSQRNRPTVIGLAQWNSQ